MSSSDLNLDFLASVLEKSKISPNNTGVSFAGKSLKLNTEQDAKDVVEDIRKCEHLEYLNLEGNTLGVEASKAIAAALENRPEFKRALWKDMFTGRMKTEIPKALEFLGTGLVKAGARLSELDLSDNAFGPIGVQGLAALLRSPTCYALQELRLNNNGLGITGGKLLAEALTDCYNCSKKEGKPLALKVFIAGRNRLENDGAKALSAVFKKIETLEEVAMPQNGIYYLGITALLDAFTYNKNLEILNLNDNTFGAQGAEAVAKALGSLPNLKQINFGDCLLKTKGALLIAKGLKDGHENLEQLILESNEIKLEGGLALVEAMRNKKSIKNLLLDANQFGETGVDNIKDKLKEIGKLNILGSLEDNESEDESENEDGLLQNESEESDDDKIVIEEITEETNNVTTNVTIEEFLKIPSAENFLLLGNNREHLILNETKKNDGQIQVDTFITILMKICTLSDNKKPEVSKSATKLSEILYKDLFMWAQKHDAVSTVNNSILVNLGLIKCEDRKFKPTWNMSGCLNALKNVCKLNFIPESTKSVVKLFLQRDIEKTADFLQLKREIIKDLNS